MRVDDSWSKAPAFCVCVYSLCVFGSSVLHYYIIHEVAIVPATTYTTRVGSFIFSSPFRLFLIHFIFIFPLGPLFISICLFFFSIISLELVGGLKVRLCIVQGHASGALSFSLFLAAHNAMHFFPVQLFGKKCITHDHLLSPFTFVRAVVSRVLIK